MLRVYNRNMEQEKGPEIINTEEERKAEESRKSFRKAVLRTGEGMEMSKLWKEHSEKGATPPSQEILTTEEARKRREEKNKKLSEDPEIEKIMKEIKGTGEEINRPYA